MDRRELEGDFFDAFGDSHVDWDNDPEAQILKVRVSWIQMGQKRTERQKIFRKMTLDHPTSVSPSAVTKSLLF